MFDRTPPTLEAPSSQMCTAAQFDEPHYARWVARFGEEVRQHRKQWEFVFILRVLERHGRAGAGAFAGSDEDPDRSGADAGARRGR